MGGPESQENGCPGVAVQEVMGLLAVTYGGVGTMDVPRDHAQKACQFPRW